MDEIDRRPDGESPREEPMSGFSRRRRGRRRGPSVGRNVLIGAVVLLLGAAGAWLWLRSGDGSEAAGPTTDTVRATPPDTGRADSARRAEEEALELPPLEASDSLVRRVADDLSGASGWDAWLEHGGLVRDFVAAVVSVATGSSPAEHLDFLRPDEGFRVRELDGRTIIHPDSYARYDGVAETFASLDTERTARLYRQLRPLFEEAYDRLGLGADRTFDEAVADAVGRLLAVEAPEGPIEVEAEGGVWAFRDPELEALSPSAKHLLRMGPENARRVQEKLRALAGAVGVEAVAPGSD